MNDMRIIRVKYACKCIRTNIVDFKDWENQPQEDIRDISGKVIISAYKDRFKCPECQESKYGRCQNLLT
jgi:hypothetical protein